MRIRTCAAVLTLFVLSTAVGVAQRDRLPARDYARVPPWILPSATLDEGVIRIWNNDTLLHDLEMVSVFVSGEEFIAGHEDLERLATRYFYNSIENGTQIRRRAVRPVIRIPLRTFFLPEGGDEKSYLYTTARPDSLYMVGVVANGDWFFQRMKLGERGVYKPVSWYYQKRSGNVYCDPPDHAPPWKYMRKTEADL